MVAVLAVVDRVAPSDCTVLVRGESGTGKELVVAALHDASPRAGAPLVAVNCGAIPENLLESELFGHVRGAFTGAVSARGGHVAAAEGGTLFLDEVGELPLTAQVKLLRLLQAREYTPVGSSSVVRCNVRVVAATHRDLAAEVKRGRFREDLFYRLNVIEIAVPSLASRATDIAPLAQAMLARTAADMGRPDVTGFTADALAALTAAPWPGNVRQLENVVARAILLATGSEVDVDAIGLSPPVSSHAPAPVAPVVPIVPEAALEEGILDLRAAVEAYENELITKALRRTGNNKSRAAQLLGLQRSTLVEMLKRKGIDAPRKAA